MAIGLWLARLRFLAQTAKGAVWKNAVKASERPVNSSWKTTARMGFVNAPLNECRLPPHRIECQKRPRRG
jgi:hypothetical protein